MTNEEIRHLLAGETRLRKNGKMYTYAGMKDGAYEFVCLTDERPITITQRELSDSEEYKTVQQPVRGKRKKREMMSHGNMDTSGYENQGTSKLTFGRKLQNARIAAGLDTKTAAKLAGIHYSSLESYEAGKNFPSLGIGLRLSEIFRVSIYDLFRKDASVRQPMPTNAVTVFQLCPKHDCYFSDGCGNCHALDFYLEENDDAPYFVCHGYKTKRQFLEERVAATERLLNMKKESRKMYLVNKYYTSYDIFYKLYQQYKADLKKEDMMYGDKDVI